jgi:hypothetical protein
MAKRKDVEGRIATLERQLAEIRVRAVEAGEFRLVDKAGRPRAVLEVTRRGPRLALLHEDGTIGVEVTLAPDGPGVRLADEEGLTRLFLGATRDAARVGLSDGEGNQRLFLGVSGGSGGAGGKPSMTMYDRKQREVWEAVPRDGGEGGDGMRRGKR